MYTVLVFILPHEAKIVLQFFCQQLYTLFEVFTWQVQNTWQIWSAWPTKLTITSNLSAGKRFVTFCLRCMKCTEAKP